jgi:hypothetical protein
MPRALVEFIRAPACKGAPAPPVDLQPESASPAARTAMARADFERRLREEIANWALKWLFVMKSPPEINVRNHCRNASQSIKR